MAEIRKTPQNGFKVSSLFAGGGGSSLGYRMAGFSIVYANEFLPAAQETYRANAMPWTVVDGRDVKTVQADDILKAAGIKIGELDVFDGSPPCQAFSTAGRREKGWGTEKDYEHGASQKNEELFSEYVRLRDGLMPRAFVAENVSGLVKGAAKGFFLEILAELKRGYRVSVPKLDGQWLGVPQARQRIVFIGVRDDLGIDPPVVAPLPHRYSVREAFAGLDAAVEPESDISRYAIGAEYDKLNPGQQSEKYFSLVRADPTLPCPTIMSSSANYASAACVVHPDEKRKFSIAELKRLSGFPDDFELVGDYGQRYERLGNAVPPPMMFEVAKVLRDRVLLPARAAAKTFVPKLGSPPRSTSDLSPKGAGKKRSRAGTRRKAGSEAKGTSPA